MSLFWLGNRFGSRKRRNVCYSLFESATNIIEKGIIHKLNAIISHQQYPDELKRDAITLLTSLSKGTNNNIIYILFIIYIINYLYYIYFSKGTNNNIIALCDYGAYQIIIDVLISTQSFSLLLASLR